jgi:3-deoxy-D-manno-octulosonic-acid transferase
VPRGGEGRVAGRRGRRAAGLALGVLLDAAYLLAAPFLIAYLAFPSRLFTRKRYRAGLRQKLGGIPAREGDRPCLWVHAVSVGEVRAVLPLLAAFRGRWPDWDLWVSTSTDTGRELAERSLPAGARIIYWPLDLGFAVRRALRRVRPTAVALMELELWPNFLLAAERAAVPVVVLNGRISARSFPRYRRLGFLARGLFGAVKAFAAQGQVVARRLESLGVPGERIEVLGNLKHDAPPSTGEDGSTAPRLGWSLEREAPVLMGGCTHPGEEEILLEIWSQLRAGLPGVRLILAPRHIERAREVEARAASLSGLPVLAWSRGREGPRPASPCPLVLVDVIGELDRFYLLSDVVFVGGSLTPRGGHNLLEPARLGKAVLFGPSVSNFEEIAAHLLERRAAIQVKDPAALGLAVARLLGDSAERRSLGERARRAAEELGGATERHLEWLQRKVGSRKAEVGSG